MAETVTIVLNTQAQTQGITATVSGLQTLKGRLESLASRFLGFNATLGQLGATLASVFSAGAFVNFTRTAINNADALAKQAQSAGMSVEQFSALSYVGKLANVSQEQMIQTSKHLSEWLAKTGQSSRDLTQALIEQADVFAAMPDGQEKVRLAVERFGRTGQHLIPLLNQGSEALRRQMEEAREFGAVVGPRFAANAQQFNDNLTRFSMLFRGMFNMLADALLPTFIRWQESILKWIRENPVHIAAIDSLIQIYKGFALTIAAVGAAFDLAFGASARFLGNLSVTGSFTEAWKAAGESANETLDGLEERLNRIHDIGRKPDVGGALPDDIPLVDSLENLKLKLENNAATIDQLGRRTDLSEAQRTKALRAHYNERVKMLEELHAKLAPKGPIIGGDGEPLFTREFADAAKDLNAISKELATIQERMFELNQDTFFGRFTAGLRTLSEEFDNLGASIADVMLNGIRRSIDAVADGIWAVIDGTATWGELFLQVGRSIISDLIRIAIQETVLAGLKKSIAFAWAAFQTAMRGKDVIEANATEAAKTPALAANATLASISSYGVAAAIGVAAVAAALAAAGAFEHGGIVHGSEQLIRVNERGTEAVLNAQATAFLGEEMINALNAGRLDPIAASPQMQRAPLDPPASAAAGPRNIQINVLTKGDLQALKDALATSEGQALIADAVRRQRIEIGIP